MSEGAPAHLWRFDLDPERRALARAEAVALGARHEVAPGLYLEPSPCPAGRAAYGVGGGELLGAGQPDALGGLLPAGSQVHVLRAPWKVAGNPLELLARIPGGYRIGPRKCGRVLYATEAGWYLVREAQPTGYESPTLPHRTSTSTSSQLARAVVNLVARPGERLLDPLCGSGVILVEGARIGCAVSGSDQNAKLVWWARRNLRAVGLSGEVEEADAFAREPAGHDALVADLPYGRRLEPADLAPYASALPRLARRWALIVHHDLRPALEVAGHPPRLTLEVPKPTFVRYVHVGGEAL
ncbi:MAG TPA: hypothetical protein DEA08_19110 [Planctomycetes bacterium]|nr:hypothetical protein [Planctomycetota bacterium]